MHENDNLPVRHITDDQHALYAIARHLDALKLHGWCDVLLLWLSQYDGLERYLDLGESPPIAVRELLARYVANGQRLFPKTIAADLANLPFLHYRAKRIGASGDETYWEPLAMSFIEFAQGGDVAVWHGEAPLPDTDVTKTYLLSSLVRRQMTGHRTGEPS